MPIYPKLTITIDLTDRQPILDHYQPEEDQADQTCAEYLDHYKRRLELNLGEYCPLVQSQGNTISGLFSANTAQEQVEEVQSRVDALKIPGITISTELGQLDHDR